MYAREWRAAWTPAMTYHFHGLRPIDLYDLTPAELMALEAQLEELKKAGA
jgi:hypothetical protein